MKNAPKESTLPDQQRLIFIGKHFKNACTLLDYDIPKESTFTSSFVSVDKKAPSLTNNGKQLVLSRTETSYSLHLVLHFC
jgi:hypothetical protein